MSLAQDIRNAFDAGDRAALERALAQIGNVTVTVSTIDPAGNVTFGPDVTFGQVIHAPITDCVNPQGCACEHKQHSGCLWRRSTP